MFRRKLMKKINAGRNSIPMFAFTPKGIIAVAYHYARPGWHGKVAMLANSY